MKKQSTSTPIDSGKVSPYVKKAAEFRRKKGWKRYMMEPIEELERIMRDTDIPPEFRILTAIKRYSWGNSEFWAVDLDLPNIKNETPAPMTQHRLAEILGISDSQVSVYVRTWKEMGYLRKDHPFLYPEDCCQKSPLESTEDSAVNSYRNEPHSPFIRLRRILIERSVEQVKNLPQLEEQRNALKDKARKLSQEISRADRYVLHVLSEINRGKNPLNLDPQTIESLLESTKKIPAA